MNSYRYNDTNIKELQYLCDLIYDIELTRICIMYIFNYLFQILFESNLIMKPNHSDFDAHSNG